MATRRGVLGGLLAAMAPKPGWADAGDPSYLAAARLADGSYRLVGLTDAGAEVFRLPLPDRGHAAAAHPLRPEAVAFARRPGRFAVVVDCRDGAIRADLTSPPGRHFYGHGAFSADGSLLLTTENDYDGKRGVIGVWDVAAGYLRIEELESGGLGPHEMLRLPGGGFAVANGGIETHPDSDREILNAGTMQPNLTFLTPSGGIDAVVTLDAVLHQNSIRHLAVREDGLVAAAMQWQGDGRLQPPLLGLFRMDMRPRLLAAPMPHHARMQGYAGSVAFSGDGEMVAITSPKGGLMQVWEVATGDYLGSYADPDICGVAAGRDGFCVTTGAGKVAGLAATAPLWRVGEGLSFDNHLVAIRG
jgi:hypothetical protein